MPNDNRPPGLAEKRIGKHWKGDTKVTKRLAMAIGLLLTGSIFLAWGCGGPPEPPPKPQVIVKKVPAQPVEVQERPGAAPEVSEQDRPAADRPGKDEPQKDAEGAPRPGEPKSAVQGKQPQDQWLASIPGALQKMTAPHSEQTRDDSPGVIEGYDPTGKIDPFEPIFRTREQQPSEKKEKRQRRIPLTPLEKLDLSQLRLVGVIQAESGNRAMVEEASGKGYIIKKGTYIGLNEGVVTSISKDMVVVRETVEDLYGEVKVRDRELKIEKPPGEL